ncbi:MAG TPA: hypothetical protein VMJ52_13710 [Xanthobacteraceae bacterium]|nr:hypothetical protein [Xanthobacteraceae bacterium]
MSIFSARSARGAVAVLAAIYAAVEFIRRNPEAAEATSISNVRGKIVGRFRFKIFYRVVEAEGAIEIVRHTSRRAWLGQDE